METSVTEFTAWGLAAGWPSVRWVEPIRGYRDQPVRGVRLGHANDSSMVLTCTYARRRVDEEARAWGFDPVREIAYETTYTQANLALHQISKLTERPDGLISSLIRHARQRADGYRDWPVTRWGGQEASTTTSLASWQSGFSLAYRDAYVVVHACGIDIDQIVLERLDDLSGYEFSDDPAEAGAMHWELWRARPDFGGRELAAMLATV
jgi:hypothetical protein